MCVIAAKMHICQKNVQSHDIPNRSVMGLNKKKADMGHGGDGKPRTTKRRWDATAEFCFG